ncbi:MAG TPA: protein kinase [Candidatus Acidoferrum sp.]|nr:protein kinase [Candidatus Acidoferrum sp.]
MSQEYSIGQRLGDYEILGVLGAGGMGKVYKVRNTISDRVEAMKILLPDLAGQKDLADRFLREIKLLASLSHPNIAALRTALTLDNQLVMILEFVDGVTLSSRLQQGPLPASQAIKYVDQVLAALSYAHKQNIIHRDIKPGNMMLSSDGAVKLMDFGIARSSSDRSLTMTGTTLGSLNYMPPEQVKGEPADNRSDLYSLGVSLYELVTGDLPFQATSNYAMMAAHLQEEPKPPSLVRPGLPPQLNEIILMAMAKDPNQRFQSADAFRGALKHVAAPGQSTLPVVASRAGAREAGADAAAATLPLQHNLPATPAKSPAYQRTQPPAAAGDAGAAPRPGSAQPPAVQSGHRGLYMALGAFIVLAVLFVAGLYVPRWVKTLAGGGRRHPAQEQRPAAPDTSTTNPASSTLASPSDSTATPATSAKPADALAVPAGSSGSGAEASPQGGATQAPPTSATAPANDASANAAKEASPAAASTAGASTKGQPPAKKPSSNRPPTNGARSAQSGGQPPTTTDTVPTSHAPQAQPGDEALAQEVEQKYDEIDSRSGAVEQSLDNLKRQQAAAGYGLRGDIVSAEQRMKTNLSKAQYYMQKQDSKNAKKYLDMAEAELQTIEKFLGH